MSTAQAALIQQLTDALGAIHARINGEWDHPALVAFGPLTVDVDTTGDCAEIARRALATAQAAHQGTAGEVDGKRSPRGVIGEDLELVASALNTLDTVLLHNKTMSGDDQKQRKALLTDADDALVRVRASMEQAQRRANFFEGELREIAKELREWDGTPDGMETIMAKVALALRGGTSGMHGASSAATILANTNVRIQFRTDGSTGPLTDAHSALTSALSGLKAQCMPATAHTDGPWHVDEGMISIDDQRALLSDDWCAIATGESMNDDEVVVALAHPTNARRIVACVEACSDMPTQALEDGRLGQLLRSAARTHDTLSELAENGELPVSSQTPISDHLEESAGLFNTLHMKRETDPIAPAHGMGR